MKTKCLFGGALLSAGVCAGAGSTALAGEFQFGNSTLYANINSFSFAYTTMSGNGTSTITDTYTGTSAYATASFSDSSFSFFLQTAYSADDVFGNDGTVSASIGASFTVLQDVTVRLDPGATSSSFELFSRDSSGYGYGYNYPMGTRTYYGSDTLDIFLTANTTYTLFATGIGYWDSWFAGQTRRGGEAFSMTIVSAVPLPPAAFAGLGMLAGLGAYKRIRRR